MSEEGGEKRPRKPYKRPLSAHETRKLRAFNILKSKFQMLKWDLHQQGVRAIGLSTEGDLLLEVYLEYSGAPDFVWVTMFWGKELARHKHPLWSFGTAMREIRAEAHADAMRQHRRAKELRLMGKHIDKIAMQFRRALADTPALLE